MKTLLQLLIISLATLACIGARSQTKPNVLLILADDLGVKDLGYTGSTYYETPHIDRLAATSTVFTQAYAGSRVCSPSRATILTGKFTARHGITDWIGAKSGADWRELNRHDKMLPASYVLQLPQEDVTLAETLKANGYKTFFAGKWHLGDEGSHPEDHGFDINKGGWHSGSPVGGYFAPFKNPKLSDDYAGENLTMRLAKETAVFMAQAGEVPFFAFLSFYAVHSPLQTTEEKWRKYQEKAKALGLAERGFAMERKLPVRQHQDNPVYAGLVESVDDAVGFVIHELERLGLAGNTIVIFTSDNGGVASGDAFATSNLPYRGGKGYQWEGGLRVPLLIRVPGQKSNGRQSDDPVTGADIYPTILDYANIDLLGKQHADGVSLRPIIGRGRKLRERPLYWHYPHYGNQGGDPSSVIRQGKWKLIHYYEDQSVELYDLQADPAEHNNLAAEFPRVATALHKKLKRWLRQVNAAYPEPDPLFDAAKRMEYDSTIIHVRMPRLEAERKRMLLDDFLPNADWWGSKVTKD